MRRLRLRPILFASAGIATALLAVVLALPRAARESPETPWSMPWVDWAWIGSDPPTEQFDRDANSVLQPARPCSAAINRKPRFPSAYRTMREVDLPPRSLDGIELPVERGLVPLALDLRGRNLGRVGQVSVVAFTFEKVDFEGGRGFAVRVVNRTNTDAMFSDDGGNLIMALEALHTQGGWQPIEGEFVHPQGCLCGFGRGLPPMLTLKPDEFWEFAAPEFDGPFETFLRFTLSGWEGGRKLYSHAFPGRIHPEQFIPTSWEECLVSVTPPRAAWRNTGRPCRGGSAGR